MHVNIFTELGPNKDRKGSYSNLYVNKSLSHRAQQIDPFLIILQRRP